MAISPTWVPACWGVTRTESEAIRTATVDAIRTVPRRRSRPTENRIAEAVETSGAIATKGTIKRLRIPRSKRTEAAGVHAPGPPRPSPLPGTIGFMTLRASTVTGS